MNETSLSTDQPLLGISVIRADGRRLGHGEYLGRNFNLWIRGLGLEIPIVTLQYPPHHRSESQISDLRERMLASWF